jgi:hypothetical protein
MYVYAPALEAAAATVLLVWLRAGGDSYVTEIRSQQIRGIYSQTRL